MFDKVINAYFDLNGGKVMATKHGSVEERSRIVKEYTTKMYSHLQPYLDKDRILLDEFGEDLTNLTVEYFEEGYKDGFAEGVKFVFNAVNR
jgi:hypothetical protein